MNFALHIKILYGLVTILLLGTIAMDVTGRYSPKSVVPQSGGQIASDTATEAIQPDTSNVVVGAYTPSVGGVITAIDGTTMKVKAPDASIATVLIGADTKFQIAGPSKDPATIQKELDAYNAQVALLMKDSVKNKAALAALYIPPTVITYPATLADFKVDDHVLVVANSINASGAYVATILTKNPTQ